MDEKEKKWQEKVTTKEELQTMKTQLEQQLIDEHTESIKKEYTQFLDSLWKNSNFSDIKKLLEEEISKTKEKQSRWRREAISQKFNQAIKTIKHQTRQKVTQWQERLQWLIWFKPKTDKELIEEQKMEEQLLKKIKEVAKTICKEVNKASLNDLKKRIEESEKQKKPKEEKEKAVQGKEEA